MQMWLEWETWEPVLPWMLAVGFSACILFLFVRRVFSLKDEPEQLTEEAKSPILEEAVKESVSVAAEPEQQVKVEAKTKPEPVSDRKELKDALLNTRNTLFGRIKNVFSASSGDESEDLEALEEVLYTSDLGPSTVQRLVESVSEKLSSSDRKDFEKVRQALKSEMVEIFSSVGQQAISTEMNLITAAEELEKPVVWMVVGVNGAGKTTTIGKLANALTEKGLKVMVVAGDTFRAAASDQLQVWSERANVEIFSPEGVSDPSAVAFDGCQKAKSNEFDVVIIDTAGRLHTQSNLMEELKKMKRVIQKVLPDAPNETLIVLDSNSGQNALMQAEKFNEALELSGAILTKLDGSAKGGVAVGLACQYEIPIKLIGVGEGINDLRPFEANEFVDSIL